MKTSRLKNSSLYFGEKLYSLRAKRQPKKDFEKGENIICVK